MEDQDFDPIQAEKKELDILNTKGMEFEVQRRGFGPFGSNKTRKFTIKPLPKGVMHRLSAEYIHLDMDEELIAKDALLQAKKLVNKHAMRCARIVAIAVLNNSRWYHLLVGVLTRYFYMRVTSQTMWQLTVIINQMSNYGSFTNSIRYLSTTRTTLPATEPDLIEQQTEDED